MLRIICLVSLAPLLVLAADNEDLPDGNGKETFVKMCSNCHALKRVTKTRYPKKFWESVVDDMVSRGAEGTEEDASIVISYLSRNFGKPVDINKATAKQLQAGLSFSPAHSELIVNYRTANGPFKSFDDLLKVQGLSPKLLDEQKANITF
jgi:competence ComEA-like helix-hairpin-helix protein